MFVLRTDGSTFSPVAGAASDGTVLAPVMREVVVDPAHNFPSRVILAKTPLHIPDWDAIDVPPHERQVQALRGAHAALYIPLLREGECIGVLALTRDRSGPFTDVEIALAGSFADQAVIAIENVRLFNETREALERQTATAEILRVISESPTDVQPVLEAVAKRAGALCRAEGSRVWLVKDGALHSMTSYGPAYAEGFDDVLPISRESIGGRTVLERRTIQVDDVVQVMHEEYPGIVALQERYGFRTVVNVPLMREGEAVGVISLLRSEVRPFTDSELALLSTFADQAVIAIENVRLWNETKEALDQQRASGEVLAAISSSLADTAPVFERILRSCESLFGGIVAGVNLVGDDGLIRLRAYHGPNREGLERVFPLPVDQSSGSGLCISTRSIVHYPDIETADVPDGNANRLQGGGLQRRHLRAHGLGGQRHRRHFRRPGLRECVLDPGHRTSQDLRRPGGDRHPERAPVERDAGGARAPDRDCRHPARHQQLPGQRATGIRRDRGNGRRQPSLRRCSRVMLREDGQ